MLPLSLKGILSIILGWAVILATYFQGLPLLWATILTAWWPVLVVFVYQACAYKGIYRDRWVGGAVAMIPISTMLLGNAMVPLYYYMGHSSMHGGNVSEVHGMKIQAKETAIRVDLLTDVIRPLYISAYTDKKQFSFSANSNETVGLYLVNHSDEKVLVKFKRTDVPSNIAHYIRINNLPNIIELSPGQARDIMLEIKTLEVVPRQLKHAIIQLNLMDASHIGKQGQQKYWKKMIMPSHEMHERMKNE